jgi:hypothetical protein
VSISPPRIILLVIAASALDAGAQTAPRVLTAQQELRVDADRALLTRVWADVMVTRAGEMYLSHGNLGTMSVFDAAGNKSTFGRLGDGPNEFRHIRTIGILGDSVWTGDIGLRRLTIVAPDRRTMRSVRLATTISTPGSTVPVSAGFLLGAYSDGTVLYAPQLLPRSGPLPPWAHDSLRDRRPVIRATPDGQFVRVVAWTPALVDCGRSFPNGRGGSGNAIIPFCAPYVHAVAPDGDRFAFVSEQVANNTAGSYRVTVMSSAGDTVFARTYTHRAVAIPRAKTDSAIARSLEPFADRPEFVVAYRNLEVLTHFPPVRSILVGRDRTIWLELWTAAAERSWLVLDARGSQMATLRLPATITVVAADMSNVWGLDTDELGAQGIVRYGISGG